MSNTKHTPTPWSDNGNEIIDARGAVVGGAVTDKDAAFMIRACNSHDQLVSALRNLIAASDAYSTVHAPDGDDVARMVRYAEAFNNARAVLAATEA